MQIGVQRGNDRRRRQHGNPQTRAGQKEQEKWDQARVDGGSLCWHSCNDNCMRYVKRELPDSRCLIRGELPALALASCCAQEEHDKAEHPVEQIVYFL